MKIKYQFSLFFLVTTTVVVFIVSIVIYYYTKKMILNEKYTHLESISEAKETGLKDIIQSKFETVGVLNKIVQSNSKVDQENQKIVPIDEGYIGPIKRYKEALKSVLNFYLIDRNGIIIEAFDNFQIGRNYLPKDTTYWMPDHWYPGKKRAPYIEGLFLSDDGILTITICSPVYVSNQFIGTIVTDLDASDILLLTNEYAGLGETGETMLAVRNGKTAFISPGRFNEDLILDISKLVDQEKYAVYHALHQKEGILLNHLDYTGKKVIASLRYIDETKWGMITKIDEVEAMQPINEIKQTLLVINAVGLILLFFAAILAGNYFAKPIAKLAESINRIKEGDLSRRINIKSRNELGTMASSFNEMADKLDKNIHELKVSNESLNKFAYIITHDLKSPVISIASLAQLLKDEYSDKPLGEEGVKLIDMMLIKTEHANELIEGVLSSAQKGFVAKEKHYIDCQKLLPSIIHNLNPPSHIEIRIKGSLPVVHFNKVALIQVFQNLLSNAIKFINKPKGIIEVEAHESGDKLRFAIKDNGKGISESDFSKIFLMFESSNAEEGVESHGIGLSIVKKIITENQGEIWLESEIEKGTTFFFTIPK